MLKLESVTKIYNQNSSVELTALADADLTIETGESVVITGPSGSGKSTLLQIIGCISKPTYGKYFIGETDTSACSDDVMAELRNRRFGFILQNFGLMQYRSVYDNVKLPLMLNKKIPFNEISKKCKDSISKVGLSGYEKRKVWELSGGEKQRVAIARAITNDPSIILADEPTGSLDSANRNQIMQILTDLNSEGITIIAVTHDLSLLKYFKRHIEIKDGKIISNNTIVEE